MRKGAAILYLRSKRIKARNPSCHTTVMQWRTLSYPFVALRYLTIHPQRITWRLNQERGPRVVPAVPSMACIAEYKEKSVKSDNSRSRLPKMCPRGIGALYHHFRSCILLSGLHLPRICFYLPLSEGLKTCYPPH